MKDFDDCSTPEAMAQVADRGGTIRVRRSTNLRCTFEVTITGRGERILSESRDYDSAIGGALLLEFARAGLVKRMRAPTKGELMLAATIVEANVLCMQARRAEAARIEALTCCDCNNVVASLADLTDHRESGDSRCPRCHAAYLEEQGERQEQDRFEAWHGGDAPEEAYERASQRSYERSIRVSQ